MAQPAQAPVTRRDGQAAVELVVALFCLLLVTTGLLQLVLLATADTDTLAEATARASDAATGSGLAASFQPVRDWGTGRDGLALTRDDEEVRGSLSGVRSDIAAKAVPDNDWGAFDEVNPRGFRALAESGDTAGFGFVHARAERDAETIPAARPLFGVRSPSVGNDVWMVEIGGLH